MKIVYTCWGIASRANDTIYLNQNLIHYPKLLKAILLHEKKHTSGLSWKDFKLDLRNNHLKGLKKEYYKFILQNPKSFSEFSPFWIYRGSFIVNPIILCLYGLILTLGGTILWILK